MNKTQQTILIVIVLIPFLILQGTWVFQDAKKRGIKAYWFWGLICLLNTPTNLIIYLIVSRVVYKRKN